MRGQYKNKKGYGLFLAILFLFFFNQVFALQAVDPSKIDISSKSLKRGSAPKPQSLVGPSVKVNKKNKKKYGLKDAALILQEAVTYLDKNAIFMADSESNVQDIRDLAVKIYKTEAFCVLKLAHQEKYISWPDKNPLADWDSYYDGTELFQRKTAIVFGDPSFHRTQIERLMFVLRGSIHENIFSMIYVLNKGQVDSILPVDEFKYGGHPYQDIDIEGVIDLYSRLAAQTSESIDKKYQEWQLVFYRTIFFMLREIAYEFSLLAQSEDRTDDYYDLLAISRSNKIAFQDLKKSLSRT